MTADDPDKDVYDVVVVGGGVVGCAVARLLAHHELSVAVLEAGPDVGAGTSKANTAILHTGFDATPGSIEARLVARGYALLREYAPKVGISIEPVGALLVAWDDEQTAALGSLAQKAAANGYMVVAVSNSGLVISSTTRPSLRWCRNLMTTIWLVAPGALPFSIT